MKKPRHNFHKGIELHKICSIDEFRPVMNYIYFEYGYAIASNGYLLIKPRLVKFLILMNGKSNYLTGHFFSGKNFQLLMKYPVASIEKTVFLYRVMAIVLRSTSILVMK